MAAQNIDQLLLPFAEREYIDVMRAANILGIGRSTVYDLHRRGYIEMLDYALHKRKRVRYRSIIEFCDRLRKQYCIQDRRPPLSHPMFRHHDRDILPFPLDDTMTLEQVAEVLGYVTVIAVRRMVEEGRFEAYQLFPGSPWRVSKTSFSAYLQRVRDRERIATYSNRNSAAHNCET